LFLVCFIFTILVAHCGELKLGFFLSEDYLEIEIVSARDLPNANTGRPGNWPFNISNIHKIVSGFYPRARRALTVYFLLVLVVILG
jgi:hypothetical protein